LYLFLIDQLPFKLIPEIEANLVAIPYLDTGGCSVR
jgi:hypothetical protein